MHKNVIVKKVIAKLSAKTEEEMDAEYDALQENKEDLIKHLSKELNKKGFKSSMDVDGGRIYLDIENKKGDKFSFSEDGTSFKEDYGYLVLYDENSKKNLQLKFEIDSNFNFKNFDLSKLLVIIK